MASESELRFRSPMLLRLLVLSPVPALAEDLTRRLDELALPLLCEAVFEAEELMARVTTQPWDLVVLALEGSPEGTTRLVEQLRSLSDPVEVLVLGNASEQERGAWIAAGALAGLDAHLDPDILREALQQLLERRRDRVELEQIQERVDGARPEAPASQSESMRACLETARKVARHDTTLLILGETGVGKEHLARAIHAMGPRAQRPFVPVHASALPETLLETELFGHAAGAFTGATKARRGLFELADGGTLFLDEIGELAPHLQVKLLRVLQDHEVHPVGASAPVRLDVRFVAATHRDLEREVAEGRFRADLYYRIAVVTLRVPALRERPEDIPSLARERLAVCTRELGRPGLEFTPETLALLAAHSWPGNVRELANAIERATLLSGGPRLTPRDFPELLTVVPGAGVPPEGDYVRARAAALQEFDLRYFTRLLEESQGRVGEVARKAGLTPRGLYQKMQRLGLHKEDFRPRS